MKCASDPTEEQFLHDVRDHRITVVQDSGVCRRIRFARPETGCMHFDIVTWPGHLAYTGDMGAFTFARLFDMFEFFRDGGAGTDKLRINVHYWMEKLVATDRNGGHEEFNEDRFVAVVNEYRLQWVRDAARGGLLTKDQRRDLWEAVQDEVLSRVSDGEHAAFQAAHEFSHKAGKRNYSLDDFWDHDFKRPTFRFVWACYAIAWGIRQYDEATELPAMAEKDCA